MSTTPTKTAPWYEGVAAAAMKDAPADGIVKTPAAPGEPIAAAPDPYAGVGGSYILDPVSGRRARVAGPNLKPAAPAKPSTESGETAEQAQ